MKEESQDRRGIDGNLVDDGSDTPTPSPLPWKVFTDISGRRMVVSGNKQVTNGIDMLDAEMICRAVNAFPLMGELTETIGEMLEYVDGAYETKGPVLSNILTRAQALLSRAREVMK